jgi:hypothetical protein
MVPENYKLNLSTGGKSIISEEKMVTLPFVRGRFISIPIEYRPANKKQGKIGFERYDDPEYHRAVRAAATAAGLKVFSCPGKCGSCAGGRHACGSSLFDDVVIAIGIH